MTAAQVSIAVRPVHAGDAARWRELWQGYLDFYRQALPEEVTQRTWQRLLDDAQPLHGLLAIRDHRDVVGFAIYHMHLSTWSIGEVCYLEDLYVDAAARGCGAGRKLIEAVYAAADEAGATRVYWHTDASNARARKLYDRIGVLTDFIQYRRPPKRP